MDNENVLDLFKSPKVTIATMQRVHSNFDSIIRSQIELMLQRGVPEKVLLQIIRDAAAAAKAQEAA